MRTTLQNLALVLGTLVGGSFVILASPIPKISWILVLSIVVLMTEVFLIFKYIFNRYGSESENISDLKKDVLDPLDKIVTLYMQAEKDEITWEQYDFAVKPLNELLKEQNRLGYNVNETERDFKKDNFTVNSTWICGIGLFLLGVSLLAPYGTDIIKSIISK